MQAYENKLSLAKEYKGKKIKVQK